MADISPKGICSKMLQVCCQIEFDLATSESIGIVVESDVLQKVIRYFIIILF